MTAPAFGRKLQVEAAKPVAGSRKRLSGDQRRRSIIDATLLCLARDGAEGVTLRSVCRELEVAPSLVTHFFENWRDLLAAAYEMLVERFMSKLTEVVAAPHPSARARMDAVIRIYLSTDWSGDSSIGASIAFWQLSRSVTELRPLFGRYLAERRRLLRRVLRSLAVEAEAEVNVAQFTDGFILMLDGIWLEISLNPGSIAETRTRQMCWFWLDAVLGSRPAERRAAKSPARPVQAGGDDPA